MGQFHTKVAGVTTKNDDGANRQDYIRKFCKAGMPLIFKREPDNPYDPNATSVWVRVRVFVVFSDTIQIGFINRDLAGEIARHLDRGEQLHGQIVQVTGGSRGKSLGVNIILDKSGPISAPTKASSALMWPVWGCFGVIILLLLAVFVSASDDTKPPPPVEPATVNEPISRSSPVRDVTRNLYKSMSLDEAAAILGSNFETRGKVGDREFYRWQLSDGRTIDATFDNDKLTEWDS